VNDKQFINNNGSNGNVNHDEDEGERAPTPACTSTKTKMNIVQTLAINDVNFTPKPFSGTDKDTEKTERWLEYFYKNTAFRGISGHSHVPSFVVGVPTHLKKLKEHAY